jgi:hypothetical protein
MPPGLEDVTNTRIEPIDFESVFEQLNLSRLLRNNDNGNNSAGMSSTYKFNAAEPTDPRRFDLLLADPPSSRKTQRGKQLDVEQRPGNEHGKISGTSSAKKLTASGSDKKKVPATLPLTEAVDPEMAWIDTIRHEGLLELLGQCASQTLIPDKSILLKKK